MLERILHEKELFAKPRVVTANRSDCDWLHTLREE